jgi:hypothetical protein
LYPLPTSYDGASDFECEVDGERLRLSDLDDGTARPLRFAALARLAAAEPTVATCQAALAVAAQLGHLTPAETTTLQALFTRLLLRLLQANAPQLDAGVVEAAERLIERSGLTSDTEQMHLAEDLVWDTLVHHRAHGKTPSAGLRALAERLRIAPHSGER